MREKASERASACERERVNEKEKERERARVYVYINFEREREREEKEREGEKGDEGGGFTPECRCPAKPCSSRSKFIFNFKPMSRFLAVSRCPLHSPTCA